MAHTRQTISNIISIEGTYTAENMQSIGAKEWKGTRYYINNVAEIAGFVCERYGSGNIRNASIMGMGVSNTVARKFDMACSSAKVYWESGTVYTKNFPDDYINELTAGIKTAVETTSNNA